MGEVLPLMSDRCLEDSIPRKKYSSSFPRLRKRRGNKVVNQEYSLVGKEGKEKNSKQSKIRFSPQGT